MKKLLFISIIFVSLFFGSVVTIFAHAVVKPAESGVAAYQTFTLSVPNEKDDTTIAVKLLIPNGVTAVTPNVKPGWRVETKTEANDPTRITEVLWSDGMIPQGQRDEFLFSAKMPSTEVTVMWKVYQTYKSGETVSWDQEAVAHESSNSSSGGPASFTKIINDLKKVSSTSDVTVDSNKDSLPLVLSLVSLAVSGASAYRVFLQKKQ